MFCSNHFVSGGGIPGRVPTTDRASLLNHGLCGKTVSKSSNAGCSNSRRVSGVEFLSFRCSFRNLSSVCYASFNSNSHRRNPDFSRPNKNNGFSQNWIRKNEEKEESLESDSLSSRNGPFPSFTGSNKKSPATSVPGPREREIVELFRKVQAQLRERSAAKEDKKTENSPTKSKESENVDSLLKLLRKHSAQQVKKNGGPASKDADFIVEEDSKQAAQEPNSDEDERSENNGLLRRNRPKSSFQKRSPVVPQTKPPLPAELESEMLSPSVDDSSPAPESNAEIDVEDPLFDEISDDETTSELYESDDEYDDDDASEELDAMKLTELRALAKSRGLKGFSKLKKSELIHLLSQ